MKKPRKRELVKKAKIKLLQLLFGHSCAVGIHKKEDGEYYLVVRVTGKMTKELKKLIPLDVDGFKVEVVVMDRPHSQRPLPDKMDYNPPKDPDGKLRDELLKGAKKKK